MPTIINASALGWPSSSLAHTECATGLQFGSSAPPIRSIAVLPLQNLSGDPSQEYFADGMTDEVTTQLAKIRALRVTSRTSTNTGLHSPQFGQAGHCPAAYFTVRIEGYFLINT